MIPHLAPEWMLDTTRNLLDYRCRVPVYLLNTIPGVGTFASCAGHTRFRETYGERGSIFYTGLESGSRGYFLDGEKIPVPFPQYKLFVLGGSGFSADSKVYPFEELYERELKHKLISEEGFLNFGLFDPERKFVQELTELYDKYDLMTERFPDMGFIIGDHYGPNLLDELRKLEEKTASFWRDLASVAEGFSPHSIDWCKRRLHSKREKSDF